MSQVSLCAWNDLLQHERNALFYSGHDTPPSYLKFLRALKTSYTYCTLLPTLNFTVSSHFTSLTIHIFFTVHTLWLGQGFLGQSSHTYHTQTLHILITTPTTHTHTRHRNYRILHASSLLLHLILTAPSCSLLLSAHSLLTAHCSLLIAHCSLLIAVGYSMTSGIFYDSTTIIIIILIIIYV